MKFSMKNILLLMFLTLLASRGQSKSCLSDPKIQTARSSELQEIYKNDQDDRKFMESGLDKIWPKDKTEIMNRNDIERRRRVAEIFAEGCFKTSADYVAAAMVFQHGIVPDHFYQTFIWSKKALDLGDVHSKHMMALGIDRYLVNIGQKQLFGSQAHKVNINDLCWCIQSIEKSFPESLRLKYLGKTKADQFQWVKEINGKNSCPAQECEDALKPTPREFVPGFW